MSDSARGDQARLIAGKTLTALTEKTGPADSQWYGSGVWHLKKTDCWPCTVGPATLAATLWRVDGRSESTLFNEAVATFDRTIAARTNANGSFGDTHLPDTQFFGIELGTTYLLLGNRLGPHHRKAWKASIAAAADYLIRHKELTWETNGNVNLGNTELEWLAWAITGEQRFRDAYELSWRYTIHPPQSRWPGYGLHLTRPAGPNGDVGAGYLAENGGSGPGFDPEYTTVQLSVASRAYLLSGDTRFRRLASILWNQLAPRVKRPAWTFDARGGTRRSHEDMLTGAGARRARHCRRAYRSHARARRADAHGDVHDLPAERPAELGEREPLPRLRRRAQRRAARPCEPARGGLAIDDRAWPRRSERDAPRHRDPHARRGARVVARNPRQGRRTAGLSICSSTGAS